MEKLKCPECQTICNGKRGLSSHKRIHNTKLKKRCFKSKLRNNKKIKISCPECNSKQIHKDGILKNRQRYICKICKKRFLETTKVYKKCLICGKPIKNIRNQNKYCSRKCKSQAYYNTHKYEIRQRIKKWLQTKPQRQTKCIKARMKAYHKIKIPTNSKCEICDSTKNLQRHHQDYSKPLEVKILCESCHKKTHKPKSI